MILDVFLLILFLVSAFLLWYRISEKLPELIAIPDEVITARFEEDSAKLRLFLLNIKTWYREKHYEHTFWNLASKILYRVHLFLMRTDNNTVILMKKARENLGYTNSNGNGNDNGEYWKQLKEEPTITAAKSDLAVVSNSSTRIQEVRMKK